MIRALLTALATVVAASWAAAADPWPWSDEHPATTIVGEPWSATEGSAAFDAQDAFVFDDVPRTARLDEAALAIAVRIDRDRLAAPDDFALATVGDGRVDAAFGRFVAYGPDGLAYASLELTRGAAGVTRIARAPTPSLVAMLLPTR
ncbi:hypothetical protein [Hansschlegelia zhihuaiae]|uniref:Uncharacterized protein n=1 Tax=Hansschlegelia zhihuaiae TaxID=405005 RepID=A0A4Q0MI93_9HYPH|nr:hypothetical protein [Hansschlegelia zhihuaiae]RXF72716.1 hypothetical protein EK403_14240 [Hansschlegelia zhihuaiae]